MSSWIVRFLMGVIVFNITLIVMGGIFNHPLDIPTALIVMVMFILGDLIDKHYQSKKKNN